MRVVMTEIVLLRLLTGTLHLRLGVLCLSDWAGFGSSH